MPVRRNPDFSQMANKAFNIELMCSAVAVTNPAVLDQVLRRRTVAVDGGQGRPADVLVMVEKLALEFPNGNGDERELGGQVGGQL